MITSLFEALETSLTASPAIAIGAVLVWGVLSVLLSPCHLAAIPLLIAYVNDQKTNSSRHALLLSATFSLGIVASMIVIGLATVLAGRIAGDTGKLSGYLVSAVFILIGLHMLDIISIPWMGANKERVAGKGLVGALMLGLLFGTAAIWA